MPKTVISATLALAALEDQCKRTNDAYQAYLDEKSIRDNLIRDSRSARIPYSTLIRRTKLSRDRLVKIASSADPDAP